MNYFEIFDMPVSLQVNKNELQKKYDELQKKHDFDEVQKQNETSEDSLLINNGYNIFLDADETIKYVLQLKGLFSEEEQYELAPEFLVEMKEIEEMLANNDVLVLEEAESKINYHEKYLYEQIQNILENYNEEITTGEQLLLVKEYYYKKKYLDGILARLDGIRNIASQN